MKIIIIISTLLTGCVTTSNPAIHHTQLMLEGIKENCGKYNLEVNASIDEVDDLGQMFNSTFHIVCTGVVPIESEAKSFISPSPRK